MTFYFFIEVEWRKSKNYNKDREGNFPEKRNKGKKLENFTRTMPLSFLN